MRLRQALVKGEFMHTDWSKWLILEKKHLKTSYGSTCPNDSPLPSPAYQQVLTDGFSGSVNTIQGIKETIKTLCVKMKK